jgi:hypothetical protein
MIKLNQLKKQKNLYSSRGLYTKSTANITNMVTRSHVYVSSISKITALVKIVLKNREYTDADGQYFKSKDIFIHL